MRDFGEIVKDKEIPWVRHWIDATYDFSRNFIDPDTNEMDYEALGREEWEFRKALKNKDFSKNKRAEYLWGEAMKLHSIRSENGKKGGRPRKNSTTATGNDQGTAGDAPHREAGENLLTPGNGAASGIANVSDDALAEGGGNGNVPLDMHGGSDSAALESGTPSAEVDVYSMPPSPSAAQAKSLAYRGAFGNVRLTDLQYAELGLKFGNKVKLDRAIDSLSAKIENGEEKPKNHFATLVKWSSYRADIEEKESKPRGSNMDLHNYEVGRKLGLLP